MVSDIQFNCNNHIRFKKYIWYKKQNNGYDVFTGAYANNCQDINRNPKKYIELIKKNGKLNNN